jgi:predicted ester cyclase
MVFMSSEENKAVVKRYREIHNSNNLDPLNEVLAPAFVAHEMMPNVPQNLEGAKMIHKQAVAIFPDMRVRTEALIADGDKVVEQWSMSATHTGAPFFFGNFPASGKKINVTGITTYRIANGKIVETWSNMDTLGIAQQVGAIPSQPAR